MKPNEVGKAVEEKGQLYSHTVFTAEIDWWQKDGLNIGWSLAFNGNPTPDEAITAIKALCKQNGWLCTTEEQATSTVEAVSIDTGDASFTFYPEDIIKAAKTGYIET